ncbi:MAG: DUF4070 domain-containing protein, partial [Candidatus Binatia bacterium]
ETPREASLIETKKYQNTRGDSLQDKLARIRNAGLEVSAGFIVGFDNDDATIFEDQYRFIQDNGILLAMVGMLTAVPKTPLYERLEKAGRLRLDDPNCNIVPAQMTPQELQQGYWQLLKRLYDPQAFFDRYFQITAYPDFKQRRAEISIRANEGKALPTLVYGLLLLKTLVVTLIKERSLTTIGAVYLKNFFQRSLKVRADIIGFAQFMNRCVTHWHFYKFTQEGTAGKLRLFNSG